MMNSSAFETTLSPQDTYVLARALAGMEWQNLPCSPLARLILSNTDPAIPDHLKELRRLLGPTGLHAVWIVDPNGPAPESSFSRSEEVNVVPELPVSARLTDEQQQQAAEVG